MNIKLDKRLKDYMKEKNYKDIILNVTMCRT